MSPKSRLRAAYVASALATTAIGLVVHFGGTRLPLAARDVVGDALWAIMVTWWISALGPQLARLRDFAAYSLGVLGAVFIERAAALRSSGSR